MKILTVCGMGSGSSLILKMNVDSVLEELGINADVEACDLGSVGGSNADLIISTTGFENQLQGYDIKKIFVTNVIDKEAIKEKLLDALK